MKCPKYTQKITNRELMNLQVRCVARVAYWTETN